MPRPRTPSGIGRLPTPRVVRQIGRAAVGFRDRGHGHGDLDVLGPDKMLLADVHGGTLPTAPRDLNIAQLVDQGFIVSDRAVAILFAAAPDLYRACAKAYRALSRKHGPRDPLIRQLAKALKSAASLDSET